MDRKGGLLMKYRKLGKTGLDVSTLSYGASSLGSVFKPQDEAEGKRTVHTALEQGINLIDVSPYYGLTKAETALGKALREVPRDQYLLSTKAGRYGVDEFDFSASRLQSSFEESAARLHTDYFDIFLLHDIEYVSLEQIIEESIPTLQKMKAEGKIRNYGISGLPLKVFREVLKRAEVDVILSYCHYSLNDNSLLELLPMIEEKGIGLINASPISMGLLSKQGPPDWHAATAEMKAACKQAAQYCLERGENIAKLAIQYACSHEGIPTTLVGTGKVENILNNIKWMQEPIDLDLFQEVQHLLRPIHNQTWLSGLIENND